MNPHSNLDPVRLRKTLAFLLLHRPDVGHLVVDADGWYSLDAVVKAVRRITRTRVDLAELEAVINEDPRHGFRIEGDRIRAQVRRRPQRTPWVPDILYFATSEDFADQARERAQLSLGRRRLLHLHTREHRAWLAALRRRHDIPEVLYVDASRARRAGVRFRFLGNGVFGIEKLLARFVLNLRPGFGVQVSAGGFLLRKGPDGEDEVALVKVRRRSGTTWEVAKGKMELGETPMQTAMRELQEEMGFKVPLIAVADLGVSHYGFTTPNGAPRLKVLHLFVFEPAESIEDFIPEEREGIEAVSFFSPDAAVRAVTHGSLRDPVRRLRSWLHGRTGHGVGGEE